MDNGIKVAVCSTSNERAVSKIVEVMLGPKIFKHMRVFAGDIVPKKKPNPASTSLPTSLIGAPSNFLYNRTCFAPRGPVSQLIN